VRVISSPKCGTAGRQAAELKETILSVPRRRCVPSFPSESMGERKVLIRYIPPDFDPSIIPKTKRDRNRPCEVRMMLPFSMRCNTCGEYMGRGKKFNSRKEICAGEDYMGIKRIRFVIKCSVCSAEISFKTDPKNTDYECEYGAMRNFELWKDNAANTEEEDKKKAEDEIDSMRSLESRTLDSKLEMDVLDALDEIKAINQRHERVDIEGILDKRAQEEEEKRKKRLSSLDDDATILKSVKFASSKPKHGLGSDSDEEEDAAPSSASMDLRSVLLSQMQKNDKSQQTPKAATASVVIRKKRKNPPTPTASAANGAVAPGTSGQPGLAIVRETKDSSDPSKGGASARNNAGNEKRAKVEEAADATGGGLAGFGMYGSSDDEN
jgi:hypothetical protein